MHVSSLSGQHVADTTEELRVLLSGRHNGQFATFWLSHDKFPVLLLGINADKAWLNFIPADEDPGFLSQGDLSSDLPPVEFVDDDLQPDLRPANCVVPLSTAEQAVVEFYETGKLPAGVSWLRL
jgi:hypothetical protein